MKTRFLIIIGIALMTFAFPLLWFDQAYASCMAENEINWNAVLSESELVFTGSVTRLDNYDGPQKVTFFIHDVIKGEIDTPKYVLENSELTFLENGNVMSSSVNVDYKIGKTYKVYVQNDKTNLCTTKIAIPPADYVWKSGPDDGIYYSESPEFIVQDVVFLQEVYYPNELGFYEVEITDRNGNPVEMFVTGRVDYDAPWGPSNFSPVGNYDKQKQRFVGELTIPGEIIPGTYTLKLNVHGLSGGPSSFSGISEVDFVIGERPDSFVTLFEPSSLGSLMGENDDYSLGESRTVNVQLVQGHFYSPPIPNHPVTILVYGTDWDNFNPKLLEAYEVVSDSNGYIHKELSLDDRNICEYDVKIKSEFEGFEYEQNFDFGMANTKIFYFQWNDEEIPVTVKGECSIPLSMDFDQPNKTMTIELDTSDAKKRFGIHFPHRLLDGELTVLVNEDVNFDNFSVDKRRDEAIVRVDVNSDHTKVEIIGTSAIPEFESIAMMILVLSVLPVILLRKQLLIK